MTRTTERPTLQQLQYLVAAADHGHFGRAAEACHVSQPGLSGQIRELERRLGVPLFERVAKGVLLTEQGAAATGRARAVLRATDDLVAAASTGSDGLPRTVRLGVIPTMAPYLLPRVLPAVRRRFADLQLELREDRTDDLVARLKAGSLDLLLLAVPVAGEQLTQVELAVDPFLLAVPETHRLARRAQVASDVLEHERVLLLDDGHCLRDQALTVCRLAGATPGDDVRATSLSTLVQMVVGGLGVTLLPESAAAVEASAGSGVAVVPFRAPAPARTIGLVWRDSSPYDAGFRSLAATIALCCRPGTPQVAK